MAFSYSRWGNELYTGKRSYDIVGHRRWWYVIAAVAVIASAVLIFTKGLNPGIEFRGGSEFTVSNVSIMDESIGVDVLSDTDSEEPPRTSVVGGNSIRIQTEQLSDAQTEVATRALADAYDVSVDDVTTSYIGPSWGADVTSKAVNSVIAFILLVGIFLAIYFRAWRMALAALIALLHDLAVTVGVYALIGFEVTPASVIGFLTILAYSLYDTVVVFDKVRENTEHIVDQTRFTYAEAANLAVNQTMVRSINTTVVALLPVGSILFIGAFVLGAGTLRDIALSLFVGMAVGAVSSVFLAAPLEVTFRAREKSVVDQALRVEARRAKQAETGEDNEGDSDALIGTYSVIGSHQGQKAQPKRRRSRHS